MLQSTQELPHSDVNTLLELITARLSNHFPDAPNNKVFIFPYAKVLTIVVRQQDLLMSLLPQTAISAHRRRQILAVLFMIHHDLINTLSRAILVPYNKQTKIA
ncbi:hypothetical protein PTTG_25880 [Puccinia triticina 1-1 BBBD Race 1]|uniref:Uncharacterized protein n=2 Tax=Puccinia triticina TaxID=208348 RepID=A0A180GZY4_PUCT1|nr:uncharacterized protein PtA15_15A441 [Puccinia triticina]OAV97929.1 hypothetical protein PTTG_25880 [Puccinia triticina 1-1 BBBD Race 1]WAQ92046.1 hypothetical protein PtA15_15A441 [Puccinia triticina]WAR62860.1 hypothetical protein PtB15_15B448 [Puccinia triticina]